VWREVDKLGSVIFIHPADNVMTPHLNIGPCEYPVLHEVLPMDKRLMFDQSYRNSRSTRVAPSQA
jgi:hypothetical protein